MRGPCPLQLEPTALVSYPLNGRQRKFAQYGEILRGMAKQRMCGRPKAPVARGRREYYWGIADYQDWLAERAGFEPAVGYEPTHAFQAG